MSKSKDNGEIAKMSELLETKNTYMHHFKNEDIKQKEQEEEKRN